MSYTTTDLGGQTYCHLCATQMAPRTVGDTEMLLCPTCGLGRVRELVKGPDYWSTSDADGEELAKEYWTTARSRMFYKGLAHLQAKGAKGRIVDLGGGVGYFADCALRLGWDAYSVDVSQAAQKVAAERLGKERSLSPDQAEDLAASCDAVTLWCVIAHVPDPLSLVRQALNLLKPGGRLLITTPNFIFQGTLARILSKLKKPYDLACRDHLLHFTPGAINRLLGELGVRSWTFEYLGVTENCILSPRLAKVLVPLKRIWNYAGSRTTLIGLPPLCAELQVVGVKAAAPAGN